jgi:hypothetical protein
LGNGDASPAPQPRRRRAARARGPRARADEADVLLRLERMERAAGVEAPPRATRHMPALPAHRAARHRARVDPLGKGLPVLPDLGRGAPAPWIARHRPARRPLSPEGAEHRRPGSPATDRHDGHYLRRARPILPDLGRGAPAPGIADARPARRPLSRLRSSHPSATRGVRRSWRAAR